jgi:hypothetical protein
VSADTVRLFLSVAGAYMIYKTLSAPKRGTFLTLVGNISRDKQPRTFGVCIVAGWALAIVFLFAAALADKWLPLFAGS